MPSNLLGPLITSNTRLKLLLRFFLNQNLSGYLQGLSKELDENTDSVRIKLNRHEAVVLLSAEEQGRREVYSVNTVHPLTTDLSDMLFKLTSIDLLVDRVVARNGNTLQHVRLTGAEAMGINSAELQVTAVGEALDKDYLDELMSKVETILIRL